MKQAVKSAFGLGNASTTSVAPVGAPFVNSGYSAYGPTVATIPVTQTVTVPTMVDTVETIQQPVFKETTTVQKQVIPAVVEHREVAPVVHQRIRQEEVEEIQPVIHREREKTEIHKIVQPLYTTATMGIAAEERTLAAQVRPEIRISGPLPPASILPTTQYESAQKVRVDKAPIIMETERKRIIEEVQPVLYKEVIQPHVIRITQPIYEKIIEADVYIDRVLPATTYATPVTTFAAPVIQQVAPIAATSTMNIAEPTSAYTQTFDITTPVNAQGISANRIEGVSQGVQVAPLQVSVQPLTTQSSLGIQQPISSTSFQTLPQQQYLGAQSSLLGSQGGLAQPGFASGFGAQQPLAMQQYPQSSLGMQPGFSQSYMQPGFQQSSFAQPGFQQASSFAQPGLQQGSSFAQPGLQQGFAQPGLQQGSSFAQPGLQQGLGQSNLGASNMGMQQGMQGGLTQGLTSGLGQSMGQQLGSSLGGQGLGGVSQGLGGMGSSLGSALATAF